MFAMKPNDVNLSQYNDVVETYHGESDRAAAVLAGSFVEHYLASYLKEYLVRDSETDALFEGFGPLATFSQRISMGAALGLFDSNTRRELRAIKEIRNHFAHHPASASFGDSLLDKHFARLHVTNDPAFNVGGDGPLKDRKLIFLFSISFIVTAIGQVLWKRRHATPGVEHNFDSLSHSPNVSVELTSIDQIAMCQSNVLEVNRINADRSLARMNKSTRRV
jgi:hypothetical protein